MAECRDFLIIDVQSNVVSLYTDAEENVGMLRSLQVLARPVVAAESES